MWSNSLIVTENLISKVLAIIVIINIPNILMASRTVRASHLKFIISIMVLDCQEESSVLVTGVILSLLDVLFALIS
jgi:hypothetical protein